MHQVAYIRCDLRKTKTYFWDGPIKFVMFKKGQTIRFVSMCHGLPLEMKLDA